MTNHIKTASYLADLLDSKFNILGIRVGIDPILGLIPGGGDFVSLLLASYIVWIGYQSKIPSQAISRMIVNILLDFGIGLIPFIGDIADVVYKSNLKNLEILKQYVKDSPIEGEVVK